MRNRTGLILGDLIGTTTGSIAACPTNHQQFSRWGCGFLSASGQPARHLLGKAG